MEQMHQKHKVCVQYWVLNASLSTDREEDHSLPGAQRVERKAFGKGGPAPRRHLAVGMGNCSVKETYLHNENSQVQFTGTLVHWVLNCINEKLETHSNK